MNLKNHVFCLSLLLFITGCSSPDNDVHTRTIVSFGTTVEVTLADVSEARAIEVLKSIEEELHYMHDRWHAWRPSSITQLNKQLQSGEPFQIAEDLLPLLTQSKELYESSLTYFNPAIGKLIELWGFYKDNPEENYALPDQDRIKQLLISNPNMNDIEINDRRVRGLNNNLQLDFGGYAKGFGVEQLIEQLRIQQINNAMVNAGGDIKAIGARLNRPWKVGIENPYLKTPLGWLYLESDESIFTSGDYRRYFEVAGKRYHHIIDPENGYPTEHARGVTVITGNAAVADAAATALMVAPQHDWLKLKQSMGLKHILVVAKDGTLYCDAQFAERLTLLTDMKLYILDDLESI